MKISYLAATTIILSMQSISATSVCLTYKEARQLWPRIHLHWYGPNHCWSNRRGKPRNLRYDLIRENHAQVTTTVPGIQVAQADEKTVTETKDSLVTWPTAVVKPIRVIEIIRPSIPVPITPVTVENVEALPPPTAPPGKLGLFASLGGAFSAIALALLMFSTRTRKHVKRTSQWIFDRTIKTRKQIASYCFRKRTKQPPIASLGIRQFLRKADRAGYVADLSKVLDHIENAGPVDEWQPRDDSPLACWARSIRAAQDTRG